MRTRTEKPCPDLLDTLMAVGLALFLLLLPFHLVIKRMLPGPIGTYWKEILIGLLVALWAIRCLRARRLLLTDTPLDGAVFFYFALLLLRFVLDRSGWVGAWGLYVSIMYLPLFWIVPALLRRCPTWTLYLIGGLVGAGAVAALGGLIEFALNVPLWPSEEIVQRQGFPDVFIYGTHIRRVYFTFDSPTTLANTLAMLLPLALSLFMVARRPVARLGAGLAAALMAGCIVVTFSRGIWVATVIALVVMALFSSLAHRRRRRDRRRSLRPLLVIAGTLALIVIAWAVALLVWRGWEDPTYQGVVELSPRDYDRVPVTQTHQDLLHQTPALGQASTQFWTLLDPIAAQSDTRQVLYQHPPKSGKDEIIYSLDVPQSGALRFAIALSPEIWSPEKGDGVSFQLHVNDPSSSEEGEFVFVRYINPKHNPSDRRWRNFVVDLSPWAGRRVNLGIITEAGPAGDWAFDWAGWAELQVVAVEGGYFDAIQTEDAVVRHTRSITDWARDETNRDRLAAWSLALRAWRAAPLWGQGLGTTGAAALRTRPATAFVTESQVLKSLVELGPLGFLALAYLWFQIARLGLRAYRAAEDPTRQVLLLGILASLLIVFVDGLVYQNLEVKQVNAYFWTLAGILAFLARHEIPGPDPGAEQ